MNNLSTSLSSSNKSKIRTIITKYLGIIVALILVALILLSTNMTAFAADPDIWTPKAAMATHNPAELHSV